MKRFNVSRKKAYKTKGGEEKVAWLPVGQITEFDNGNQILELNNSSEQFNIFPADENRDEKFTKKEDGSIGTHNPLDEMRSAEISPENIQF